MRSDHPADPQPTPWDLPKVPEVTHATIQEENGQIPGLKPNAPEQVDIRH